MPIRKPKPTSPGMRFVSYPDFAEVTKSKPEKSLVEPLTKSGGRDNHGHISMRRLGGGHKRKYRIIDFRRNKFGMRPTSPKESYFSDGLPGRRVHWLGLMQSMCNS